MSQLSKKERLETNKQAYENYIKEENKDKSLEEFLDKTEQTWIIDTVGPLFKDDHEMEIPSKEDIVNSTSTKVKDFFKKLFSAEKWKKIFLKDSIEKDLEPEEWKEEMKKYHEKLDRIKTLSPTKDDMLWLEQVVDSNLQKEQSSQLVHSDSFELVSEIPENKAMVNEEFVQPSPIEEAVNFKKIKSSFTSYRKDQEQGQVKSLDQYFSKQEIGWLIAQAEKALEKEEQRIKMNTTEKGSDGLF